MWSKAVLRVALVYVLAKATLSQNANSQANSASTIPKAKNSTDKFPTISFALQYSPGPIFAMLYIKNYVTLSCQESSFTNMKIANDMEVIAEMANGSYATIVSKKQRYKNAKVTTMSPLSNSRSTPNEVWLELTLNDVQCSDGGTYYCYSEKARKKPANLAIAYYSSINITYSSTSCGGVTTDATNATQTTPSHTTPSHTTTPSRTTTIKPSPQANNTVVPVKNSTTNGTTGSQPKPEPATTPTNRKSSPQISTNTETKCNMEQCKGEKYVAYSGRGFTVSCSIEITGDNSNVTFEWWLMTRKGNSKLGGRITKNASTSFKFVNTPSPNECINKMYVSTLTYMFMDDAYEQESIICKAMWTFYPRPGDTSLMNPDDNSPKNRFREGQIWVCVPGGKPLPITKPTDPNDETTTRTTINSFTTSITDEPVDSPEGGKDEDAQDVGVGAEERSNTAAIVGGVAGGVGLIALAVIGGAFFKRKQALDAKAQTDAGATATSASTSRSTSKSTSRSTSRSASPKPAKTKV